jgi:heme-degrading monooxygenase HmoA
MILEMAILQVKEGEEKQFEKDFITASQYISAMKGYEGHRLDACIEVKNKYLLLVNWENLTDHTVGFRESDEYQEWKKLLHHYYDPFPVVEHYTSVFMQI